MAPAEHPLLTWFEAYVDRFRLPDGTLEFILELKHDHCHRVGGLARDLAAESGWGAKDVELAEMIGRVHDVGRFSQFQRFRTLHDPVSVDHGREGCRVLQEERALAGLPPSEAEQLRSAVCLHNKRDLPPWLVPEVRRWVWLVRDADKLDALRILDEAWESGQIHHHPEMCWNLPPEGEPNPALCSEVAEGRLGSYALARSVGDFQLIQLSWAFDLQYPATRRRALATGVFDRMAGRLRSWPVARPAVDRALAALD